MDEARKGEREGRWEGGKKLETEREREKEKRKNDTLKLRRDHFFMVKKTRIDQLSQEYL